MDLVLAQGGGGETSHELNLKQGMNDGGKSEEQHYNVFFFFFLTTKHLPATVCVHLLHHKSFSFRGTRQCRTL